MSVDESCGETLVPCHHANYHSETVKVPKLSCQFLNMPGFVGLVLLGFSTLDRGHAELHEQLAELAPV